MPRRDRVWPDQLDMYLALEDMVKFVEDQRNRFYREHWAEQPVAFAKEFSTIRFGLCRGVGHTTMALRDARQHLAKTYMIVLCRDQVDMAVDMAPPDDKLTILPLNEKGLTGKSFADANVVIVDCASLVPKKSLDRVYHTFAGRCPGGEVAGCNVSNPGDTPLFLLLE